MKPCPTLQELKSHMNTYRAFAILTLVICWPIPLMASGQIVTETVTWESEPHPVAIRFTQHLVMNETHNPIFLLEGIFNANIVSTIPIDVYLHTPAATVILENTTRTGNIGPLDPDDDYLLLQVQDKYAQNTSRVDIEGHERWLEVVSGEYTTRTWQFSWDRSLAFLATFVIVVLLGYIITVRWKLNSLIEGTGITHENLSQIFKTEGVGN